MAVKCPKCHSVILDDSRFCSKCGTPIRATEEELAAFTKTLVTPSTGVALGSLLAGKYRILEEIGRGGMGIVYKAEDIKLKRTVALKFLPHQWTADPGARERFIHEARAASALDHPNICIIHEIEETEDGRMYIAMAFYEGESLRERIKREPLKAEEAIDIAIQVAQGMAKAHEKGIVHRDIKPANIRITNDGVAKIVDFGLAKLAGQVKLTREGTTIGTVAYMSPEQARGDAVDQRTDIWSLGVVLYETLSGKLPFKGDHEQSLIHSILKTEPEPITKFRKDLPVGLEQVILKSLMKNPSARYQSMDEVAEDLKAIAEGLKPLRAKAGLFRGKIFGIKKVYTYAGLACLAVLAGVLLRIVPRHGKVYDSIAVLPLEILSKEPGQEYYSEGLADELITRLYQIAAIRVAPLSAVRDYRTSKKSYKDIRQEMDVKAILDLAVLRVGNRVRITAKLVDAETERAIWGTPYERDAADIIALQAEISQAIVREVQAKLTPQEQARLATSLKVNPAAYDAYLKGKQLLERGFLTEEQSHSALKYFQQAIELDPEFAPAYWMLVSSYHMLHVLSLMPYKELIAKAEAALNKGLTLDHDSSEAHTAQAVLKWLKWEWEESETEFKRVVELSPGNVTALARYSDVLRGVGKFDEAIVVLRRFVQLDTTNNPSMRIPLACGFIDAKRYDEAISELRDVVRLLPDDAYALNLLAAAYAAKGTTGEAVAAAEKSLALLPSTGKGWLNINNAIVYASARRREDALKILDEYLAFKKGKPVDSYTISEIFATMNDKEEAFKWLERAIQEHAFWMIWLKIDWCMDNIRSDPRFKEYLKKAGFEK
jgi:serine/threonine-protein kinase